VRAFVGSPLLPDAHNFRLRLGPRLGHATAALFAVDIFGGNRARFAPADPGEYGEQHLQQQPYASPPRQTIPVPARIICFPSPGKRPPQVVNPIEGAESESAPDRDSADFHAASQVDQHIAGTGDPEFGQAQILHGCAHRTGRPRRIAELELGALAPRPAQQEPSFRSLNHACNMNLSVLSKGNWQDNSAQVKHLAQRGADGAVVAVERHDIAHVLSPSLASVGRSDGRPLFLAIDFGVAEQLARFGVQEGQSRIRMMARSGPTHRKPAKAELT
jgi:hypothetical protein